MDALVTAEGGVGVPLLSFASLPLLAPKAVILQPPDVTKSTPWITQTPGPILSYLLRGCSAGSEVVWRQRKPLSAMTQVPSPPPPQEKMSEYLTPCRLLAATKTKI